MSDEHSATGDAPRPRRRAGRPATIALVVILLVNIGVVAAFALDHQARINPQFCATCHNMETHVDSYLNGTHLDNVHRQANVGCKDCHSDYAVKDELASVWSYVTGDYEKIFSKRKFDEQMCLNCHISLDYQATQTDFLSRNPHQSHWPDLRCGSCHLAHEEQVDYCSRCHENGGQRMTGDPIETRSSNS